MRVPCSRPFAVCLAAALSLSAPAFAQNKIVDTNIEAMAQARSDTAIYAAAQEIVDLGPSIVPELTDRLVSARDADERIHVTFVLSTILSRARYEGVTVDFPPQLAPELSRLLLKPSPLMLEGNLANLAGLIRPQPPEIIAGLLALLERAQNEGLRATTSAVIVASGESDNLHLIHDAMRQSHSDKFTGDLAAVLRGTPLPEDIVAILEDLLTSENAEARQAATRTLNDAGIVSDGLLDAALRDLQEAENDMDLIVAATNIERFTDGSVRVADVLVGGFAKANRIEERLQIVRALIETGEPGFNALADYMEGVSDASELSDLIMGLGSAQSGHPRIIVVLAAKLRQSDDPALSASAAMMLANQGEAAREVIEDLLEGDEIDTASRQVLSQAIGNLN